MKMWNKLFYCDKVMYKYKSMVKLMISLKFPQKRNEMQMAAGPLQRR